MLYRIFPFESEGKSSVLMVLERSLGPRADVGIPSVSGGPGRDCRVTDRVKDGVGVGKVLLRKSAVRRPTSCLWDQFCVELEVRIKGFRKGFTLSMSRVL